MDSGINLENARCWTCGYLLRQLPKNCCPECGRLFDPGDPRTMDLGPDAGPVARLWLQPTWLLNRIAAVNAVVTLLTMTAPVGYSDLFIGSLLAWLLIGGVWLMRGLIALSIVLYYRRSEFRRFQPRWLIVPGIALLTLLLLMGRVPLRAAFLLSRPFLDRFAREAMQSPDKLPQSTWAGVFPVKDIETFSGGMRFIVSHGFFERGGFAYKNNGWPPNLNGADRYDPLWGGWYIWTESWD